MISSRSTIHCDNRRNDLFKYFVLALLAAVMLSGPRAVRAQTFPPPAESATPEWTQNFSTLAAGPWVNNVDGSKEKAHPSNANVAACPSSPSGTALKNCFKVIYNHTGGQSGVLRQPPSSPVFATPIPGSVDCGPSGTATTGFPCIGWVVAIAGTTNTGTDVTQENINISANTKGTETDTETVVPSYNYTLSYDVYFEPGFDFAKGGKLPGLASANFDSGCTDDGSVKRTSLNWSERVMWRENGRVELYSYDQSRPSGNCGIDELVNAQAGDPPYEYPEVVPGDSKFRFQPGVWYTITLSVAVNDNNAVLYATDGSGNTLLDAFGDPIVIGGNGLVSLSITNAATAAVVGSIQYNNVALRDECDKGQAAPNGALASCASPVPDTNTAWVNAVFFSTFFGGNETKRLTCLSDTIPPISPALSGFTQPVYEELCASQRVAYIWPTNTWVPQTTSAADFANFAVYTGYTGLAGTPPKWPAPQDLTASAIDSGEIDLNWTAATAGSNPVAGYKVYSNGGILLGQTSATSFPVTNIAGVQLTPSTSYYFFVKAYDTTGNQSAFSNEAYATTGTNLPSTILPPGSVTSNTLPPGNVNAVFWAPQPNAAGYQVYRNGAAIPNAVVPPAAACGALPAQEQYIDSGADIGGLASGVGYSYTVTAIDASGNASPQSFATTATPSASGSVPSGFFVSVTPPYCQSIVAGATTAYSVNVTAPGATLAAITAWPSSSTALEYGSLYTALPAGVGVKFSPIANGTATATVTSSAATPAGIYPINITATNGGTVNWTQLELVVAAPPVTPSFTLSSSPNTLSIAPGASGNSTISVTDVGGFSGSVNLAVTSALPAGVTPSFSQSSTTGTSTLTLTASGTAAPGTVTVTVTGTSGSQTATTTLTLTVTSGASSCGIEYTVTKSWSNGFSAALTIYNNSATPIGSWTLAWAFSNGQTITSAWDVGSESQSGANVTLTNASYNGKIAAESSISGVGFNATLNNSGNPVPAAFTLNGILCN